MLLEQIERRQEKLMQERDKTRQNPQRYHDTEVPEATAPEPAKPPPMRAKAKAKTMGIQVEPELYAKLEKVRDKYKTGSLKNAMLLAAREGLKFLNI